MQLISSVEQTRPTAAASREVLVTAGIRKSLNMELVYEILEEGV